MTSQHYSHSMTNEPIRHGDVLLVPCDKIPESAKNLHTLTLALGEVTGHHHTMKGGKAQVYEQSGTKYVDVQEDTELTHQEHKSVPIVAGTYKMVNAFRYISNLSTYSIKHFININTSTKP